MLSIGLGGGAARSGPPVPASIPVIPTTPIEHVIVLYLENHSFDNVLGRLCVQDLRCEGSTTGRTSDGKTISLRQADDLVPDVGHNQQTQKTAINGGRMNGWDKINGCSRLEGYKCYQAFQPEQIPNLALLARTYVISDQTFESELVPTFGSHVFILAGQLGGFKGDNPQPSNHPDGPGWGCDSFRVAAWRPTPSANFRKVPSCFPDQQGFGPFKDSPVPWIPTIMDRMDEAGVTYRLYNTEVGHPGYTWAGCPYFAECIYGSQNANTTAAANIITDAGNGALPAVSFVFPPWEDSQHNQSSMRGGDNFIGDVVGAAMSGPDWLSTAIFITYDDCGCFYDHVRPPDGLGIRIPMVIVSPHARPGYTDSTVASFASILAFIEHNWGIPALSADDAAAYDYSASFDFTQIAVGAVRMIRRHVPEWERRRMAEHPPDPNDPN